MFSKVRDGFSYELNMPNAHGVKIIQDVETVDSSLAGSLQAVNTSLTIRGLGSHSGVSDSSLCSFPTDGLYSVRVFSFIFPLFLIPASIIGLAYRQFAIGYLNTGRDLRRMESNTRSPIFSGFGELLEGIVTVRAFSAEQKFLDGLHQKIDQTTKVGVSLFILLPSTRLTDEYLPNIDVVQLLDDEPLAAPEFRLPRCRRRAHHDALRAFGLRERGNCGYVYHFGDGIHDQYILGLSVLDSARARSQVRLPPHPYLLPIDPIHMSHDAHVIEITGCIAPLNVWSNTSTFHKNLPQSSKTTARPPTGRPLKAKT